MRYRVRFNLNVVYGNTEYKNGNEYVIDKNTLEALRFAVVLLEEVKENESKENKEGFEFEKKENRLKVNKK